MQFFTNSLFYMLTVIFLVNCTVFAQNASPSEEEQITAVINHLFDGMRTKDTSLVSAQFTSTASLKSVGFDDQKQPFVKDASIQKWLEAIIKPRPEIFDERIYRIQILVDDYLATAWTPYEFYLSDQFSHCGVNLFQLIKRHDGWKVFSIIDTRRKENCVSH